jgi:signal transduction histidine kinase/ActR/RegA family two-component response regulator
MSATPAQTKRKVYPLRDALMAALITFATSVVGLAIIYVKARDAQLQAVRTEMLQLARSMAAEVDGDLHKTILSNAQAGSPEHERLLAPLVRMHRAARDVWYVYTGIYRDSRIYWVLDTAYHYRVPGNVAPVDPIMMLYPERDAEYERAYREGIEYTDREPRLDDGHYYLSAAVPIRDSSGAPVAMLGIDMVLDALTARMESVRWAFGVALLAVFILSAIAGFVALRIRRFTAAIVSKLRRARAEAEAHAEAAEAASRAKAAFLAMMSHEIRTPMNGMLGVADLLRTMSPDPEQKRLLDILAGSGDSLLRIINDILDFSKIEAERLELRPWPFEICGLLGELEALLNSQARAKHVKFILDAGADLPAAVNGDRQRLSQILLNLGNNAVKFTDHGEVRLLVRSSERPEGKVRLEFTMRDTGIGMPAESLERLFTPFTQLAESRHHRGGGTGLGLVISQKLVNLMGGHIAVQSEPHKGSAFSFAIEVPTAEISSATTTNKVLRLDSLSVLVVEDNAVNLAIIDAMLRQLGHRITVAGNGREALEVLAKVDFDLVLMDCNMPEMDGLEATRRLRAHGVRNARVPIVALTANAMDGDRERCLASGMDDFVSKPVTIATLRAAIERVRDRMRAAA